MYIHGWLLWASWGVLGMMQIVSIRYMRTFTACDKIIKNFNMLLHISGGILILVITLTMTVLAIKKYNWALHWNMNLHSAFGLAVMIAVVVITVLGFLTWLSILFNSNPFWRWVRRFKVKNAHRYLGFALILFSQVTILYGVSIYCYNNHLGDSPLGIINISVFLGIWGLLEARYQIEKRKKPVFLGESIPMSVETYNQRLRMGEKLVILDDLVLDLRHYIGSHPGGEQVLRRNIGRDVSKFFHGAYSMERTTFPWLHSSLALTLVNSLRIGSLGF